ncbi:hypothetical protein HDV00_001440 [Rhizophlyctis rosea]|nr:hypothetical protein HDV00_001440 [Rhizophlyctis rosea]
MFAWEERTDRAPPPYRSRSPSPNRPVRHDSDSDEEMLRKKRARAAAAKNMIMDENATGNVRTFQALQPKAADKKLMRDRVGTAPAAENNGPAVVNGAHTSNTSPAPTSEEKILEGADRWNAFASVAPIEYKKNQHEVKKHDKIGSGDAHRYGMNFRPVSENEAIQSAMDYRRFDDKDRDRERERDRRRGHGGYNGFFPPPPTRALRCGGVSLRGGGRTAGPRRQGPYVSKIRGVGAAWTPPGPTTFWVDNQPMESDPAAQGRDRGPSPSRVKPGRSYSDAVAPPPVITVKEKPVQEKPSRRGNAFTAPPKPTETEFRIAGAAKGKTGVPPVEAPKPTSAAASQESTNWPKTIDDVLDSSSGSPAPTRSSIKEDDSSTTAINKAITKTHIAHPPLVAVPAAASASTSKAAPASKAASTATTSAGKAKTKWNWPRKPGTEVKLVSELRRPSGGQQQQGKPVEGKKEETKIAASEVVPPPIDTSSHPVISEPAPSVTSINSESDRPPPVSEPTQPLISDFTRLAINEATPLPIPESNVRSTAKNPRNWNAVKKKNPTDAVPAPPPVRPNDGAEERGGRSSVSEQAPVTREVRTTPAESATNEAKGQDQITEPPPISKDLVPASDAEAPPQNAIEVVEVVDEPTDTQSSSSEPVASTSSPQASTASTATPPVQSGTPALHPAVRKAIEEDQQAAAAAAAQSTPPPPGLPAPQSFPSRHDGHITPPPGLSLPTSIPDATSATSSTSEPDPWGQANQQPSAAMPPTSGWPQSSQHPGAAYPAPPTWPSTHQPIQWVCYPPYGWFHPHHGWYPMMPPAPPVMPANPPSYTSPRDLTLNIKCFDGTKQPFRLRAGENVWDAAMSFVYLNIGRNQGKSPAKVGTDVFILVVDQLEKMAKVETGQ